MVAESIQPDLDTGTAADFAANSFVIGWSRWACVVGGCDGGDVAKGFSQGRCVNGGRDPYAAVSARHGCRFDDGD